MMICWYGRRRGASRAARAFVIAGIALAAGMGRPAALAAPEGDGWAPAEALARFVEDYQADPMAQVPVTFGVVLADSVWTVRTEEGEDGAVRAELSEGPPARPTFYFETDAATLERIDRGAINGITAMAQTRADDPAPMTLGFFEGYEPEDPAAFQARFLSIANHFWTRGQLHRVLLRPEAARTVHGADAVAVYYDRRVHSAWYHVRPGQHINADPEDQVNANPSLFVITKGEGRARIGDEERAVRAGEAIFVPAGVVHEFWNPGETPYEFLIVMWGFQD